MLKGLRHPHIVHLHNYFYTVTQPPSSQVSLAQPPSAQVKTVTLPLSLPRLTPSAQVLCTGRVRAVSLWPVP
jgi:hypothetical protein